MPINWKGREGKGREAQNFTKISRNPTKKIWVKNDIKYCRLNERNREVRRYAATAYDNTLNNQRLGEFKLQR